MKLLLLQKVFVWIILTFVYNSLQTSGRFLGKKTIFSTDGAKLVNKNTCMGTLLKESTFLKRVLSL